MCGTAGLLSTKRLSHEDMASVVEMAEQIRYRAPVGDGFWPMQNTA